jgi:hypothetical protein
MGHGMLVLFADAGIDLYHTGQLTEGLELLAARLDMAGAGDLLVQMMGVEWTDSTKQDPKPVPTPKPQPPKPPQQPKGERT